MAEEKITVVTLRCLHDGWEGDSKKKVNNSFKYYELT